MGLFAELQDQCDHGGSVTFTKGTRGGFAIRVQKKNADEFAFVEADALKEAGYRAESILVKAIRAAFETLR